MRAAAAALMLLSSAAMAQTPSVAIVAAENFYGDVAKQIAGPGARVVSVMSNPDQDPHLFEASASVARDLSGARIVVYSGADYDPWMAKLLSVDKPAGRQVIEVATLVGKQAGDNPHLWYEPATMPAYAKALAADLTAGDPAHAADTARRLQAFLDSLRPLDAKVAALRHKYAGRKVTATEPVFGYMAAAIGLDMRNERFQRAVMNDTEPAAADVAAFEDDLRHHTVGVLLYNSQASDPAAQRLLDIAHSAGVPVVGVTETEPPGKTYQQWMLGQLDALDRALSQSAS